MLAPEGSTALFKGGCFCGAIGYTVHGLPVLSAYCHCTNCQRMMGCPFVHTIHLKEKEFFWSYPLGQSIKDLLDDYENPLKQYKRRFRCKKCGTPVASFNSRTGEYSVWGAGLERGPEGEILEWETVKPTAHQFYGTRMVDVEDEVGKWDGYEGKSKMISGFLAG